VKPLENPGGAYNNPRRMVKEHPLNADTTASVITPAQAEQ